MGHKARKLRQGKRRTSLEDELVFTEAESWPLLGLNGEPLSLEEWMRLHFDEASFRVAYTPVEVASSHFEISTVWLGVDHSGGTRPLIYETVVLDSDGRSVHSMRYADRKAAAIGHQAAVDAVTTGRLVGLP